MKVECEIEKLKNAVGLAEKVTGKNLTLPVLKSILFIASNKSLKLRATNLSIGLEIEIPTKTEKEGVLAVPGAALVGVLSNINQNDKILLQEENGNLLINTKKNKIKIKGQPNEDFPTIPGAIGKNIVFETKKIVDGLKSVYYSAATSDIKPEISSVFIYSEQDELFFVSTDSFRLAEKKIKTKNQTNIPGILIPLKNIPEIIRILGEDDKEVDVSFNKNQISFSFEDIFFTSRVIDGIFPDYRQIIPKEFKTEVVVLKQDLLASLRISSVFSDKFNQVNLSIKPKDKIFELSSNNNEVGENKTRLEATLSGEDVEVGFNQRYLLDCLQSINSDSVIIRLNQANKPILISGVSDKSFVYLVMPMNR